MHFFLAAFLPHVLCHAHHVQHLINHCPLWANPVLHHRPLFCYANLKP